jgi:hypothetical protein
MTRFPPIPYNTASNYISFHADESPCSVILSPAAISWTIIGKVMIKAVLLQGRRVFTLLFHNESAVVAKINWTIQKIPKTAREQGPS